jgi:uncharacterized membrane protein
MKTNVWHIIQDLRLIFQADVRDLLAGTSFKSFKVVRSIIIVIIIIIIIITSIIIISDSDKENISSANRSFCLPLIKVRCVKYTGYTALKEI